MLETNFFFFFLRERERELIELFPRTMKKIKNQARYEIFRQKPLTLTLLLDVPERLVALKGLITAHGSEETPNSTKPPSYHYHGSE